MSDLSVLVIVGSVRADSWNDRLARAAVALGPPELRFDIVRSDLPIYDADAEAAQPPAEVGELRRAATAADGIVVVTPEYNYGLPGPLKNTLDWLSRPAFSSPMRDKPVTSFGATPGPGNPGRALAQLNQYFAAVAAAPLPWPSLAVGRVGEAIDESGGLDPTTARRVGAQLEAFVPWIAAVSAYRAARADAS